MANQLFDDYRERGFVNIMVIIDDNPDPSDPDTAVTWLDAQFWAYSMDFDGTGPYTPPQKSIVVADTDGGLWARYTDSFPLCSVTPQGQIIDRGGVTVDDPCFEPCLSGCGYSDSNVRNVLNQILPTLWCGEAIP